MASKPDFDPNNPLDYSQNLTYLDELVHAEPELYGIYQKDENGNYITDERGNKILDPEGDYSGYYRDIQWKNKTITEPVSYTHLMQPPTGLVPTFKISVVMPAALSSPATRLRAV